MAPPPKTPTDARCVLGDLYGPIRTMNELSAYLSECLRRLLDAGFQLPLYLAAISVNGAVLAGRYQETRDGGLACDKIAEDMPDGQMMLPINIMFTDALGKAARVAIEGPGPENATLKWIN
jgi:hypothetical protein